MKNKIRTIFGKAKTIVPDKKVDWCFDEQDSRRFFFMHIPKTAGTTFRKILENHSPKGHIWPNQKFLKITGNKYPTKKVLLEKYGNEMNAPIFLGHYNMDMLQHLSPKVIILTFLRNPYERVLSNIKHEIEINKLVADPNIVVENKLDRILNIQSRMLRYQPLNQVGAKKMLTNINRINFIGITEEFDKSIALCNKMFDWNLEIIKPQNQINESVLDQLSAKSKSKIIRQLNPEIRTYKFAYNKFENLCKKYNV